MILLSRGHFHHSSHRHKCCFIICQGLLLYGHSLLVYHMEQSCHSGTMQYYLEIHETYNLCTMRGVGKSRVIGGVGVGGWA